MLQSKLCHCYQLCVFCCFYVLITRFMFLLFFLCLCSCFVRFAYILCVLCFCIVLCIVSPHVYSCSFSIYAQVNGPVPPGGNPIAVNKYQIISHTELMIMVTSIRQEVTMCFIQFCCCFWRLIGNTDHKMIYF